MWDGYNTGIVPNMQANASSLHSEVLSGSFSEFLRNIVYVWFLNTVVLDCLHGAPLSEWVG
jgi:hypothetical protein